MRERNFLWFQWEHFGHAIDVLMCRSGHIGFCNVKLAEQICHDILGALNVLLFRSVFFKDELPSEYLIRIELFARKILVIGVHFDLMTK